MSVSHAQKLGTQGTTHNFTPSETTNTSFQRQLEYIARSMVQDASDFRRPQSNMHPVFSPLALEILDQLNVLLFEVSTEGLRAVPIGAPSTEVFQKYAQDGKFFERLIPATYYESLQNLVREVASTQESKSMEHPVIIEGANDPWYRSTVHPAGEKQPDKVVVAFQDVTSSRMGERYWEEVEAWLTSVGNTVPFDFWIISRQGTVGFQNSSSVEHLGPMLGRKLEEAVANTPGASGWVSLIQRALAGERVREEYQDPNLGGRRFSRTAVPVFGQQDEGVQGALGIEVEVSSQALSIDQLRVLELGGRAAVVAHEIRHPLTGLLNFLALLKTESLVHTQLAPLVPLLEDDVLRLERLTSNILGYVRPPEPKLVPVQLGELLDRSLELAMKAIPKGQIQLTKDYDEQLPPVHADVPGLELAIENLLRNSLQAMKGRGQLRVSYQHASPRVQLTIEDNGPGIPDELKARVLDPFFTTRRSGVGLGLAIVRHVLEVNHQGKIELFDSPLGGTRWVLSWPVNPSFAGR